MRLQDYIGIPFAEQGRDHHGLDCYGLVRLIMAECYGVATRDYCDYHTDWPKDCAVLIRGAQREPEWVRVPNPQPGDVVLININGMPAHCGVYAGNGDFLHASHEAGVCLERLASPVWAKRLAGFYRHRERCHG